MSMVSQNVKHLSIKQIERLIENYGNVENIDKVMKANNRAISNNKPENVKPVSYCLESLKTALIERQEKAASKYLKSSKALTDEINAALNATIILPPKMPVNYKTVKITKSINTDQSKRLFNFSAPLWQVEKLSLDDRCKIFMAQKIS